MVLIATIIIYCLGYVLLKGVIENLKQHEDKNKTRLYKLNTPPPFDNGVIEATDNIAKMRGIKFVTDIKDIKGTVLHKDGNYYVATNIEEESDIETTNKS